MITEGRGVSCLPLGTGSVPVPNAVRGQRAMHCSGCAASQPVGELFNFKFAKRQSASELLLLFMSAMNTSALLSF